ncbi:MAG: alpha-hydroxy-acid oxidizing protein [Candidatus Thermoplasmatota archaeon]|nr:alpha-hydroxy-acid oxidizing protein [Candidatus Thermoplasmatota archaeon]
MEPARRERESERVDLCLEHLNQRIADEIQLSGLAFVMTTKIHKRRVLRLSICSHRTTLSDTEAVFGKLQELGEAVEGKVGVHLDGGVRRRTDVLKGLALGPRAVLVGDPILYGLALDGAPGVRAVLQHLHQELDRAMALSGAVTLANIGPSLLQSSGRLSDESAAASA